MFIISFVVCVDVVYLLIYRNLELCERGDGRPGLTVSTVSVNVTKATLKQTKYRTSEFSSCAKDEVDVLVSLSLTVLTVSVDVKKH